MTEKYVGGYLTKTPILPTAEAAPGIWKLDEAIYALKTNTWPIPIIVPSPVFSIDLTRNDLFDPRLIFVRNSVASYYNKQGILSFVNPDELRIDFNPLTGEGLGALIEESRTNLLQRSEELDNVYWTRSNVVVVNNATTAPDGTTTADEITELELESEHTISRASLSINMTADVYTLSAFVKCQDFKLLQLKVSDDSSNEFNTVFDMSFGSIIQNSSSGSAVISTSQNIELPNGWSRISVTGRTGINGTHRVSLQAIDEEGNSIYIGNPLIPYYIWGVQLEKGDLSSYIKTTSATATRQDDILTILDTSFLNYFSESEGTFVVEGTSQQNRGSKNSTIGACFYLNEDNFLRFISTGKSATNRLELTGRLESDTADRTFVIFPRDQETDEFKYAVGLKKTEYPRISVNGSAVQVGTSGNSGMFIEGVPPIVFLGNFSGQISASETTQQGHVKRFSYWNQRLSDNLLKYITTQSYLIDVDLALDFDLSEALDSRITFSRNSNASYFDADGVLRLRSTDEFRIDYDPSTLINLGLLIEESRTNLVTHSEDFTNGIWTLSEVTASANSTSSPDSNTNADTILETTANNEHSVSEVLSGLDQSQNYYSFSLFVKGLGRTKLLLEFFDTASAANKLEVSIDLATQASTEQSIGSAEILDSFIQPLPNNWFRVSLSGKTGQTGEHKFSIVILDDSNQRTFAGDISKGIYVWGAQIEQGGKSSSYIPTNGTSYTRTAETAVISGTNFSSWFNPSVGTFYWKGDTRGYITDSKVGYEVNDNTSNEVIQLVLSDVGNLSSRVKVIDGGSTVVELDSPNPRTTTSNSVYENGFTYNTNDFSFIDKNASQVSTDTNGTLPTVTQMSIGSSYVAGSSSKFLNGHISKILYWNRALPVWRITDTFKN